MVLLKRKEGWILNPNDKVVNAIFKRLEVTEGISRKRSLLL